MPDKREVLARRRPLVEPALAQAYARLKDQLSEAEFLARIEEERKTFDGLLDDEALALLVLDEMGANDGAYLTIAELPGRTEATVRVTIEHVEPVRTFERAGRDPGRLVGVTVADATGKARLVLWERDVNKVSDGEIRKGDRVTVVNARVKESRFGVELHVSPWSVLEVEGALDPAKRKLLMDVADDARRRDASDEDDAPEPAEVASLVGTITTLSPTRPFRSPEGVVGFVADLDIETTDGLTRIVLWNEPVRAIRQFLPGARVRLTNLALTPRGAATEWHSTPETRVERAG